MLATGADCSGPRTIAAAAALALVAGCSPARDPGAPPTPAAAADPAWLAVARGLALELDEAEQWALVPVERFEMESSGCFGTCPRYELALERGGAARFLGHAHVDDLEGAFRGRTGPRSYARLCRVAVELGFRDLAPEYAAPWTDDNAVTIRVTWTDGSVSAVRDYGRQAPAAFAALELALEEAVRTVDWGPAGR